MTSSARLTKDEEAELTWYLGQTTFHRSTLGPQLERSEVLAFGSDGKKHRREPLWERGPDGRKVGQRQVVYCRETRTSDGGYEPDHHEVRRYAQVGARLLDVYRLSPLAHGVLSEYYGNPGARWARQKHGQIWCLVHLTRAGQLWLDELAAGRERAGQPVSPLEPVEQLAEEYAIDQLQATAARARHIRRALDGAEALLLDARRTWNRAAEIARAQAQAR